MPNVQSALQGADQSSDEGESPNKEEFYYDNQDQDD